jgi:hypothetical protein
LCSRYVYYGDIDLEGELLDESARAGPTSRRTLVIIALLPLVLALMYLPWRDIDRSGITTIDIGSTHATYGEAHTTDVQYGFPLRFDELSPVWISGNMPPQVGYSSNQYEFFWSRYLFQLLLAVAWFALILRKEVRAFFQSVGAELSN